MWNVVPYSEKPSKILKNWLSNVKILKYSSIKHRNENFENIGMKIKIFRSWGWEIDKMG